MLKRPVNWPVSTCACRRNMLHRKSTSPMLPRFTLTVDRTKAQALLDEAGRSDLVLPEFDRWRRNFGEYPRFGQRGAMVPVRSPESDDRRKQRNMKSRAVATRIVLSLQKSPAQASMHLPV